jgi:putative hydrolase of the HAD superfamily
MVATSFAHVRAWVFDLDQTLYPPEAGLFAQMGPRIADFVMRTLGVDAAEAGRLRDAYWASHGTTLHGLMTLHGVDPAPYLAEVHDIDLSGLVPDPVLAGRIARLPGRRVVFTNGDRPYALRVLAARDLEGAFDAVYGVEHAGYRPKPEQAAFEAVFALGNLDPREGAMFETTRATSSCRTPWGCGPSSWAPRRPRTATSTITRTTCRASWPSSPEPLPRGHGRGHRDLGRRHGGPRRGGGAWGLGPARPLRGPLPRGHGPAHHGGAGARRGAPARGRRLARDEATPLAVMRVVDLRGARGPVTRDFRAGDVGEESFGFNVPNRALQGELEARIAALPHVELRRGVAFRARAPEGDRVRVALTEGEPPRASSWAQTAATRPCARPRASRPTPGATARRRSSSP